MIRVFSKIIKSWIKNNSLLSLYLVLSVFIIIGVIVDSGSIILHYLAIYYIAFLVFYFGFKTINKRLYNLSRWKYKLSIPEFPSSKNISYYIFGFIFISIVFHYIYIGFVPVIKAWQSFDYFDIVWIRRNITSESNTFWNYYSKFLLKAILPFSIVFLYIRKENKLLILAIILSFFYALSLMQKSYFVSLFIPILLYCFLNKKWIASFSFFAILVSGILLLVVVTNPNMRAKGENIKLIKQHPEAEYNLNYQPLKGSKSKIIAVTLTNRVFLIPGKMVSDWFKHIPSDLPYLNGCGYRFLNPINNCYKNYQLELYEIVYPEWHKKGYIGSLNTSSYMYDYANFGIIGLLISALILGFIISFIEIVFADNFNIKLSINAIFILMLSSSAISTLLFSGGWALIIILFSVFKKNLTAVKI